MSFTVRAWWTSNVATPADAAGAVVGRVVAATAAGFVAGRFCTGAATGRRYAEAVARGSAGSGEALGDAWEAQPAAPAASSAASDSADTTFEPTMDRQRILSPPRTPGAAGDARIAGAGRMS